MSALTSAVQEGLVALLLFDETGAALKGLLPADLYDAYYRPVVVSAIRFWDRYKRPPGEHALDIVEGVIAQRPDDEKVYRRMLKSLLASKDDLNAEYLMAQATDFARQQRLRVGIMEAVGLLQDDQLDEAERVLTKAMGGILDLFDPGTRLADLKRSLAFLNREATDTFPTGIELLDRRNCGPARKQLHLFIALPKRGKTWWLVHLGKQALLHRLHVVHVSLEMSEARICQRYAQTLLSVGKRRERRRRTRFELDELGRVSGLDFASLSNRPSFADKQAGKRVSRRMRRGLRHRPDLYVKEFPTGAVTVREIEGYLDALEATAGFRPDLLLVDYADNCKIDPKNYRHELGRIYVDLRGLAVRRNIAVATASQSNRKGTSVGLITDEYVAEDYSKIATADVIITYNQTHAERALGLARLYVAGGRDDDDRFTVLISQSYSVGQFCFQSARLSPQYKDLVDGTGVDPGGPS